jgi:hypothetical protein
VLPIYERAQERPEHIDFGLHRRHDAIWNGYVGGLHHIIFDASTVHIPHITMSRAGYTASDTHRLYSDYVARSSERQASGGKETGKEFAVDAQHLAFSNNNELR